MLRRHRMLLVCSGLVLLVVAAVALQGSAVFGRMIWTPDWATQPGPTIEDTAVASQTPAPRAETHVTRIDLSWVTVLVVVVVITVVALLVWRAIRRRLHKPERDAPVLGTGDLGEEIVIEREPDLPQVRRGLDLALDVLGENREPRDAIERAWLGLQDAAEDSGVRRLPAETPSEFTARVLSRVGADRQAARVLLDLYLRVRFSDAAVTPGDVAAATAALEGLRASWAPDGAPRGPR